MTELNDDPYNCETCGMYSRAYDYTTFHVAMYPFDEKCHAPFIVNGGSRYYKDCSYCQGFLDKGETFFPNHEPSSRCESGKHKHCSCSACF